MNVTDNGGACSHADFSSHWGCGRQIVACCDSVAAEQCETAQGAVSDCSRSTHARRSVRTGWPLPQRSNCRSAEKSRRARSSRPPNPERRRTVTVSLSFGHSPCLHRRLGPAASRTRSPAAAAAALRFCNTRRLSPWSSFSASQIYLGGEGCRCRSVLHIPDRFPKRASTGNLQVPFAPAGSKCSWDPLDSSLPRSLSNRKMTS